MKTRMKPLHPVDKKISAVKVGSTKGVRRTTGVEPTLTAHGTIPDPEVPEKKPRRKFTASYKLRILQEVENCTKPGDIGKILRREGLYSSNLTSWKRARDKGQLEAMSPQKRGRKPKEKNPLTIEVAKLQKEKAKLEQKLKRAELIIDAQKKISQILGIEQNLDHLEEDS